MGAQVMPANYLTGVAPTKVPSVSMTPQQWQTMTRAEQIAWLRANGAGDALTSNPKQSAMNANRLSPEIRQYYDNVKKDGGTFVGNLFHDVAPAALAAGLIYAGGTALAGAGGGSAAGAAS